MSLINDALKRAKQAQQNMRKSSQRELPLQPAGRVSTQPGSPAWIWATFFALLLSACGYLVWQSLPQNNPESTATTSSENALVVHAAAPPHSGTNSSAMKTNAAEIAAQVVTGPAPLKLQSVFYIPGRSSVMISGQSLSVGSHIREFRVVEIKPDSVTLASTTETKVLKLP